MVQDSWKPLNSTTIENPCTISTINEDIEQSPDGNDKNINAMNTENTTATSGQNKTRRASTRIFGSLLSRPSIITDNRKYSLAQLTKEAIPRLDHYRVSKRYLQRPSIGELHGETKQEQSIEISDEPKPNTSPHGIKLGWINGVFIPCLLNIWGVMLFLRLSWVVAEAGVFQTVAIIAISALVCVITTLSLSAICTNGEVKGGGVYFIISRSLGPEFGASVGIVFAFANAVAAAMNTIGFCDLLNLLLKSHDLKIIDGGINDTRIIGFVTLIVLVLICCVGMEWESKAQNFLIVIIVLAIFNFLIGTAIGPRGNELAISKGFVGFSLVNLKKNLGADYRFSEGVDQNFFSVFAIFFPSVTGIQAGANICGDLKNPGAAIPKGTFWALLISMASYVLFVFFAGAAASRDASGIVDDLINGTIVISELPCIENQSCKHGLHNDYEIMQLMSLWGPLIYAGCFAATLSTALTNLLSVPRLVQALGFDQIFPGLIFFSKPYGKHGEPYRGYVLTFLISTGFLLIGQLNVIAPLISTFYLASYALINFCTFHAGFIKPLGWRPTFKYYNIWLSLFGALFCVAFMFLIEWMSALITFAIIFTLYLVVIYRKPDVNWGSSTQAQQIKNTTAAVYRLQTISDHVKNYTPQVLVFSGDPKARPPLIDFGYMLTKHSSLLFVANILPTSITYKNRQQLIKEGQKYLDARKIKAFYNVIDSMSLEAGINLCIKTTGFGKMSPNIVLLGYKSDWAHCSNQEVENYFNILHNAFAQRMGVVVLHLPSGLDFTNLSLNIQYQSNIKHADSTHCFTNMLSPQGNATSELLHVDSNLNLAALYTSQTLHVNPKPLTPKISTDDLHCITNGSNDNIVYRTKEGSEAPKEVLDALNIFARKQPKGTINVFWLYDDGGLTILLPYIISMRSSWQNCKLRVFALSHGKDNESEEKNMANLLQKFRIKYSQLTMLKDLAQQPRPETVLKHKTLIEKFMSKSMNEANTKIEEELKSLEQKTQRQLLIHELIVQHSSSASMIVMSLPMPRKEAISAPLYMSWLEMLISDIKCPVVLARGNQTPVLTLYS